MKLISYTIVDFYLLLYNGAVDMQIFAPEQSIWSYSLGPAGLLFSHSTSYCFSPSVSDQVSIYNSSQNQFFDILLYIVFRFHFPIECLYAIYFPRTYTTLHVYIFFRLQFPIMSLLAIFPKSIFHQFLLYIVPFTFIFRSSVYFRFSLAALHIHVKFRSFSFLDCLSPSFSDRVTLFIIS